MAKGKVRQPVKPAIVRRHRDAPRPFRIALTRGGTDYITTAEGLPWECNHTTATELVSVTREAGHGWTFRVDIPMTYDGLDAGMHTVGLQAYCPSGAQRLECWITGDHYFTQPDHRPEGCQCRHWWTDRHGAGAAGAGPASPAAEGSAGSGLFK